jgi:hypothetical protein
MQTRRWVATVVERQRTKVGHGVDAEARTYNRLRIVEGPVSHRDSRLEVSFVGMAQALRQSILARRHILRARKRVGVQIASVKRLLEGNVRRSNILSCQISCQRIRNASHFLRPCCAVKSRLEFFC